MYFSYLSNRWLYKVICNESMTLCTGDHTISWCVKLKSCMWPSRLIKQSTCEKLCKQIQVTSKCNQNFNYLFLLYFHYAVCFWKVKRYINVLYQICSIFNSFKLIYRYCKGINWEEYCIKFKYSWQGWEDSFDVCLPI